MATSGSDAPGEVHSSDALNELDAVLVCPICLEYYKNPRKLPCDHWFCEDCIDRLPVELENGRHVARCPSCRQPIQLSDAGAAALPAAFHITKLVEIHRTLMGQMTTRKADQSISRPPPSPPPSPVVQQPDPPRRDLTGLVPRCHSHDNRPMDLYCETCEEHICVRCVNECHRSHQCEHAVNLFSEYKEQIRMCLEPVRERIGEVEQTLAKFDAREREMREQGEAVQQEIDDTYQQLINELQESRRRLSQEAATALQEKLQLHSLQRASVEAVLEKLKSCCEFIEEELRSQSQYQILAAKKQLEKHINKTHSEVKVSELQPAQEPNIVFTADKHLSSACSHIGDVTSKQYFSCRGLFSVNIPSHVLVGNDAESLEVAITGPQLLTASRMSCQLTRDNTASIFSRPAEFPVTSVGEGRFMVTTKFYTAGLYKLKVLVDKVDICGSPFVYMAKWKRKNLKTFARVNGGPMGVAVADDGQRVIVTERDEGITVFSNTGTVLKKYDGYGVKFANPWAVALSPDKRILVTAIGSRKLWRLNLSFYQEASYDIDSTGVAVHPVSGKIFCATFTKCNITVLNADLTLSHSFDGEGLLKTPRGVAIDSEGMVYVADYERGEVLKFTPERKYLATIGSKGEEPHQFSRPNSICIDSDDIMYVTDEIRRQVLVFTTKGQYFGSFGCKGGFDPCAVTVDSKTGIMYVCDIASGKVMISNP